MSTLHTVNKSPFGNGALLSCLDHCKPGDAVLLVEDGVYGAIVGTSAATAIDARGDEIAVFVLDGDAKARGIATDKMLGAMKPVGYDGFVDLVAQHDRTQSWL